MIVEHIKGEDNIPADCFSRLIASDTPAIIYNLNVMDNEGKENIISKYHGPMPGHFGINKTVNLMQREGINHPKLREEVTDFIKACPCCQKMSFIKPIIHTNQYVTFSTEPMKCLNIAT